MGPLKNCLIVHYRPILLSSIFPTFPTQPILLLAGYCWLLLCCTTLFQLLINSSSSSPCLSIDHIFRLLPSPDLHHWVVRFRLYYAWLPITAYRLQTISWIECRKICRTKCQKIYWFYVGVSTSSTLHFMSRIVGQISLLWYQIKCPTNSTINDEISVCLPNLIKTHALYHCILVLPRFKRFEHIFSCYWYSPTVLPRFLTNLPIIIVRFQEYWMKEGNQ